VRYILMTIQGQEHIDAWTSSTAAEKEAEIDEARAWFRKHGAAGRIVGGEELGLPREAKTVRKRGITDGPFVETKEMLGGFIVVEVASEGRGARDGGRLAGTRLGRRRGRGPAGGFVRGRGERPGRGLACRAARVVAEVDDAGTERPRLAQAQSDPVLERREEPGAGAEDHGMLVDEPVLVDEPGADEGPSSTRTRTQTSEWVGVSTKPSSETDIQNTSLPIGAFWQARGKWKEGRRTTVVAKLPAPPPPDIPSEGRRAAGRMSR
jgi:hypothetical protein